MLLLIKLAVAFPQWDAGANCEESKVALTLSGKKNIHLQTEEMNQPSKPLSTIMGDTAKSFCL